MFIFKKSILFFPLLLLNALIYANEVSIDHSNNHFLNSGVNDLKFNHLLIFGAGSQMGADYKIEIFDTIRPYGKKIYLCELESNELVDDLLERGLIDAFIPVENLDSMDIFKKVIQYSIESNIAFDCVLTYREEWLEPRALCASYFNLPHHSLQSILISQNKDMTKYALNKAKIKNSSYRTACMKELREVANVFSFPFFIKPKRGIRSEWSRWILDQKGFEEYISDIQKFSELNDENIFLLEEAIEGHELDVNICV